MQVTSPSPPLGARQSGQHRAQQLMGEGRAAQDPRAAASRDARTRPSISVTAFFPGSSLLGLWTVAKEVCARGQKEDFLRRRQGATELPFTEPLPCALRAEGVSLTRTRSCEPGPVQSLLHSLHLGVLLCAHLSTRGLPSVWHRVRPEQSILETTSGSMTSTRHQGQKWWALYSFRGPQASY